MKKKPVDTDDYLSRVPEPHRVALERLRRLIRSAAPRAVECLSYQLPAFKLDGRALVCFGNAAKHCALYPMSSRLIASMAEDLADFETSKGTIRFAADRPLPAALVKRIVKARIAENAAKKA